MGIVAKQTIKGAVWSYLGVIIGFITTTYLYTQYLTPEVVGLFGLLGAITTITSTLSSIGFNTVTNRFFPYFRDKKSGHNGYLFVVIIPQMIGFGIFILFYFFYKNSMVENNIDKSALFAEYVYLIVPITFFVLLFNLFDIYNRVLYNTVFGTFLQEFAQRCFILITILLFVFKFISFELLIIGFAIAMSLKAPIIFLYLLFKGEINFRPKFAFLTRKMKKEMLSVALFSIIGGVGSMIVFNIDKVVINDLLDLSKVGIYTIACYFGTLVVIPSKPLLKISGTLIADAWAKNDLTTIRDIYNKSCINQFIIGCFLFLGIWSNIDNILTILGPDYVEAKWVIFFIGLGYLFDMLTGTNGLIIQFSKYYRVSLVFTIILVVIVLTLLYLFIPIWGIYGAAISIAVALFLNNFLRYIFLFVKFGFQPFNYKFLIIIAFNLALFYLVQLIPQQILFIDILIRGIIITIFSIAFILFTSISSDMQTVGKNIFKTIKSQTGYFIK
ncbi:MAG: oligosaccharide flippase family protein [Marinilabiliaceae bacterium]|nr:oligosaccharide flippase family protein [Marinilabiliaceae bacterium]